MANEMPKEDVAITEFVQQKKIFADLINNGIFKGEPVIDPDKLQDIDSAYKVTINNGKAKESVSRYRDVVKRVPNGSEFVIVAIENQVRQHEAMPVRVMMYDTVDYVTQCREIVASADDRRGWTADEYLSGIKKGTKLSPCYTLVIYFGEKSWDGPKCLSDMLVLDATMAKYFNDYKMNLIEVRDGPEGFQFKSEEVRQLFQLVHDIYHKESREATYEADVLQLAGIITNHKSLYNKGKGGDVKVTCNAVQELLEEGAQREREKTQKQLEEAEAKRQKAEAEKQKMEAEIALLKSQIEDLKKNK